jgi:hypothetical protein
MTLGHRCADSRALFETGKSKRFSNVAKVATRKLALGFGHRKCE